MDQTVVRFARALKALGTIMVPVLFCVSFAVSLPASASSPALKTSATFEVAPHHSKLMAIYTQVSSTEFAYAPNEVDQYGEMALGMSGDARIYALWRVLYAYKNDLNEAKLTYWHDRIARQAQSDGDITLDLLARFVFQAYHNEANAFAGIKDAEWEAYLNTSDRAIQMIVMLERERQYQYFERWADAIDLGDTLVRRTEGEGGKAAGLAITAYQTQAYNMLHVGDYNAYADQMLAATKLSRSNAFFLQKMDMVYDLAYFAAQDNDNALAERFQALYGNYVRRYDIKDLVAWNRELCATVEDKAANYRAVIDCLAGSAAAVGNIRDGHDAFSLKLLTKAYAQVFDLQKTRFYLNKLQDISPRIFPRDEVFDSYVEAFIKAAEGHSAEAFRDLSALNLVTNRMAEGKRIDSIREMYAALRKELDRKSAEARLLEQKVQMQRLLLGSAVLIAVMLAVLICGCILWVMRMRRMHARLNAANEHAEAANAAKTRFLAVMSHELRTPLNGVLGMAQALKKEELTEVQRDQVNVLVDSGHMLMTLLNDVLDLSRIEANKVELSPTVSTMKDMVDRVVSTYTSLLEGKEVELRCEIDDSARVPMMFDVLRVYQCLSNLVSNALKFTERGSVRIIVSAQEQDSRKLIRVEVRDTGIGMSRATVARLFTDYTQADAATTRKYGGSGLGLSISRRLAELMGGTLSAHSEEGIGSTFTVTFLADDAPSELVIDGVKEPATTQVGKPIGDADTQGTRILLVDDHPVNRKVARLFLEPFGFIISEACDGQEALDLDMSRFDLVLMDINMPRMGGLEATRTFRATEAPGKHVPIIALTADAMQEQVEACLAAGMDAHLSKPIIMDTLVETVTALLKPNANPESEVA